MFFWCFWGRTQKTSAEQKEDINNIVTYKNKIIKIDKNISKFTKKHNIYKD